ncbi:MAG: aminotransferase class III-fold pyridoxal phosphate-dependent enzyme [Planctomycetes bacterium]|nr:aminotransferase class III-fold pyridoxal phosphate-dependent enzyme [Planctomycetota bacterium]
MHQRPTADGIQRTSELLVRARRVLAYGGLDGVAQRPLYCGDDDVFPQFSASARGSELVDTAGRSYVDWLNGWGTVLLGYRHPDVERAIVEQLVCGPTVTLMHEVEIDVAERIRELFPCAERVAFGKNGSDALTAAVRLARAITGRRELLQYGFHGFHDWYMCSLPGVRGLPDELRANVHPFPYADLDALARELESRSGRVAAIVMEPVREILPPPGYLAGVRDLAHAHGALLVFDEVVTALRVARGGAQELFGVTPDLACLGKGLANGMPISAIVGKRELMSHLPAVGFGMTFRGETLTLAAARAVLRFVTEHDVPAHLARVGEKLRAGFAALSDAKGVHCRMTGPAARMTIVFRDPSRLSPEQQRNLLVEECLKRGVLTNGSLLASWAHDDAAVERTLAAFDGALDVLAAAQRAGRVELAACARGFVEHVALDGDALLIAGWLLLDDGAPDRVIARAPNGAESAAELVARPDVAAFYPSIERATSCGFALRLPSREFATDRRFEFTLRAMRGERAAFRCRVVRAAEALQDAPPPYSLADGVLFL